MYLGLAIRTDLVLMSLFVGPKDSFSVLQCTLNKIDILKTLHMSQVCRRHSYKNFIGSEECQSFSSYENTNYQSQTHHCIKITSCFLSISSASCTVGPTVRGIALRSACMLVTQSLASVIPSPTWSRVVRASSRHWTLSWIVLDNLKTFMTKAQIHFFHFSMLAYSLAPDTFTTDA